MSLILRFDPVMEDFWLAPTFSRSNLILTAKRSFSKSELVRVIKGGRALIRPINRGQLAPTISVSTADGRQFCFVGYHSAERLDIRILVKSDDLGIQLSDVLKSILEE